MAKDKNKGKKRINVLISEEAWLAVRTAGLKEKFFQEEVLGEILEEQIKLRWMEEEKMDYGQLKEILKHLEGKGFYYLKDDTGYMELRDTLANADEDEREYKLTMHNENTATISNNDSPDLGYMAYKKLSANKDLIEKIINKIEELMDEQNYVDDSDGAGNDIDRIIAEVEPLILEDDEDRSEIYEAAKKHLEENYKSVCKMKPSGEFESYYYEADEELESLEEFYRHFGFVEADELDDEESATYACLALPKLNSYEGDNLWNDVIDGLTGADWDASCEASNDSTVVVFTDGSRAEWDVVSQEWVEA